MAGIEPASAKLFFQEFTDIADLFEVDIENRQNYQPLVFN